MQKEDSKIFVQTTGCLSLRMDTARIENYLRFNQYTVVDCPNKADTVLFTPCIVTNEKEQVSLDALSGYRNEKKNIIVSGCGAKAVPEHYSQYTVLKNESDIESLFPPTTIRFSEIGWVGNNDSEHIPEYLQGKVENYKVFERVLSRLDGNLASLFRYGTMGFEFAHESDPFYRVRISSGCNFRCSFCIVWKGRGTYKSLPINEILSQIKEGHSKGYRKFMLVADELSYYGMDLEGKLLLGDLLREIFSAFQDIKLGLRYFEPMYMEQLWGDIHPYITDEKIAYLNIPVQSGSEKVLEKMNRPKNLLQLKDRVMEIRKNYQGPILTHVIVGFPHETMSDIIRTYHYLIETGFDDMSIHLFSSRPGSKLENEKLNEHWEEHQSIMQACRKYVRTRYLQRILSRLKKSHEMALIPEKEFRYPIESLPTDFADYLGMKEWSNPSQEVDIVFMHPYWDGFVARLRKNDARYLQFKLKKEQRVWDEVSIPISAEEVMPIFETLREFLEPKVVVSKKRKFFNENKKLRLYMDEVENLGTFVEIESQHDEPINEFMKKFSLDQDHSAEPYGKLILQKQFDKERNIDNALRVLKQ